MKESSHTGKTVLFLYPTPNSLMLPSALYKNDGFQYWIVPNVKANISNAIKTVFSLNIFLYIYSPFPFLFPEQIRE